jgi:hypothetical protein
MSQRFHSAGERVWLLMPVQKSDHNAATWIRCDPFCRWVSFDS